MLDKEHLAVVVSGTHDGHLGHGLNIETLVARMRRIWPFFRLLLAGTHASLGRMARAGLISAQAHVFVFGCGVGFLQFHLLVERRCIGAHLWVLGDGWLAPVAHLDETLPGAGLFDLVAVHLVEVGHLDFVEESGDFLLGA